VSEIEFVEQITPMSGREACERFGGDFPWNRRVLVTERYEPTRAGEFVHSYHVASQTPLTLRSRSVDVEV
jgi:hypothetical protein